MAESEFIRDDDGGILGEIRREGEAWLVWRRVKPSFPPRSRNELVGQAASLEEARRLAGTLRRED